MKTPTYRDAIQEAQIRTQATPSYTIKNNAAYDSATLAAKSQAEGYKVQTAQTKGQSTKIIASTLNNIAETELQDNAQRRGREQAQEGIAEIGKLEESIKYKEEQLSAYDNSFDDASTTSKDLISATLEADKTRVQDLLTKDSAFNVTSNVRANNLNKLYLDKVDLDTTNTINGIFTANQYNPEEFEKQALTLADALDSVPDQFRESVRTNILQKIKKVKTQAQDNLYKKQMDEITSVRNDVIMYQENEATQNAYAGVDTSENLMKIFDALDSQVKDGNITKTAASNKFNKLIQDVDVGKALGGANRILENKSISPAKRPDKLREYANVFKSQTQANMDNNTKLITYNKMMMKANAMEASLKAAGSAQKKSDDLYLKNVVKRLSLTSDRIDVSNNDIKKAQNIAEREGKGAEFQAALATYDTLNQMNQLNLEGQIDFGRQLEFVIDKADISGDSTFALESLSAIVKSNFAKNQKAVQTDINGYLAKNPTLFDGEMFITTPIVGMTSSITKTEDGHDFSAYNKGVTDEMKTRYDNRHNYIGNFGTYETVSTVEAQELNKNFNQMSVDSKFQFIANMDISLGSQEAQKVYKAMWKDNPSTTLVASDIYSYKEKDSKRTANNILKGNERRKDKLFSGLETSEMKIMDSSITSSLLSTVGHLDSNSISLYKESIKDYYYGDVNNFEELDTNALEHAVTAVVGTQSEYNGKNVYAPTPNFEMEEFVEDIMDYDSTFFEDNGYKLPDNFGSWEEFKLYGNSINEKNFFGADTKNVSLESAGKGKYLLRNSAGRLFMNGNQPFILDAYIDNESNPNGARTLYKYGEIKPPVQGREQNTNYPNSRR